MAKKKAKKEESAPRDNVEPRSIVSEMRESFLDYAMSVITDRALPDVRDGLKPVHRRILYTMHTMGLSSGAKFRKSAAVVGDVMGKYHPHGDAAIYDSMAKLAQDFTTRYGLVIGQGNFGSIDGDNPAAMRYTEAKMSKVAESLLGDIEKDTVDWRPNYDGTKKEPIVLPSGVPNLLLNGGLGIAVGMATNIPPHNLGEVVEATKHLIDNEDATTEDLMEFVQGPDFPVGGIIFNTKDIHHAYANGKGKIVARGEAEIVDGARGTSNIIITSLPFRVNKADLVTKIADLARTKKVEGIKDLRDESAEDIRVVVELKGTAHPQKVLNALYKYTQLEDNFNLNMVCLVDGVPQTLSLKGVLESFIGHRLEVVKRRTQYELTRAEAREHILLGLTKALDNIDKIIALIKKAKDVPTAREQLMKTFKFTEIQANAILEMRLQKLAGLERKKIEDELAEIQKKIASLKALLKSKAKMLTVIKKEMDEYVAKFGDDRRTKVVKGGVKEMKVEDLIPDEDSMMILTAGGYIKRTNPSEYKKQKRGGIGVIDLNTKDEDFVTNFVTASAHSDLLFFTDKGKVYQTKMYDLPEGRRATKGKSIMNFISLDGDEKVTSVLAMPKGAAEDARSLFMVTKNGMAKKTEAKSFADVRRSGLIAINLKKDDELVSAQFMNPGADVIVGSRDGKAIRFMQSDVRAMGRTAAGVRAIKLGKDDQVVGATMVERSNKDAELLVIMANGYGKKTSVSEYKVQKRGGSGIKAANITDKTGVMMALRVLDGTESELVAMSKKSQVVRTELDQISTLGRATQGVRIMKLRAGDSIASLVCL